MSFWSSPTSAPFDSYLHTLLHPIIPLLPQHMPHSIGTDGAPAMCGQKTGFVGELRKNNILVPVHHCKIHQEALCPKSARLHPVMKSITEMVNFIRGGTRALTHRKFRNFLEEVKAAYPDLSLFCKMAKCWRLFEEVLCIEK